MDSKNILFQAMLHALISVVILPYYFIILNDFIFHLAHSIFPMFIEHRLEITKFYVFYEAIH